MFKGGMESQEHGGVDQQENVAMEHNFVQGQNNVNTEQIAQANSDQMLITEENAHKLYITNLPSEIFNEVANVLYNFNPFIIDSTDTFMRVMFINEEDAQRCTMEIQDMQWVYFPLFIYNRVPKNTRDWL